MYNVLSRTTDRLKTKHATRRRCKRFNRRLELEYRVEHPHAQGVWRNGFTTNAGAFGYCIASAFVPPPGIKLRLRVRLAGADVLEIWGRVAWVEQDSALANRAPSSFGLEVLAAPEEWFQYCYRLSA